MTPHLIEPTIDFVPEKLGELRGPVLVLAADTVDGDEELCRLIRSRLRQFFVVLLLTYVAFLARDFLIDKRESVSLQRQLLLAALLAQLSVVVLSRTPLFHGWGFLQACEWLSLLVFAAQQGTNQYLSLVDPLNAASFGNPSNTDVQILISTTWLIPWFVLAVGYPVIVPHPWRQTLLIIGLLVAVPVVVTAGATVVTGTPTWSESRMMYPQYLIWGSVAVCIGVYVAVQSAALRREAFEARKFGQYRLLQKLGEGGMGEVYLAEHRLLRRPSVIKLIRQDRAGDPLVLSRFEREVKILATLTHWNTVEVYDYGHTPKGVFYFVMEYLPGQTLHELVKAHGPQPAARVVYLLRQVCHALREAHRAGLIHRDVKPTNIMVCERGGQADVAKLLDFGLVHAGPVGGSDPKITQENTVVGTPTYMSPEQARGLPVDGRSDLYSLCVTAYFLLTGRAPFAGSIMDILAAQILETPRPVNQVNPDVPDDLNEVVMRGLQKQPTERYPSIEAFEKALSACDCATHWNEHTAREWRPPPPQNPP